MFRTNVACALLLCASLLSPGASLAETVTGRVVAIADGDTITVLDSSRRQHKVRLAGIDAPEKAQAFGNVSRQHLAGLVFGRTVSVDSTKTDRYGRRVGTVFVEGIDANLEQVRAGLAWHYKQYARDQSPADRRAYTAAESEARESGRGLWRDRTPMAPWEFRRMKRRQ